MFSLLISGHYMYIEADDGSPNDYALLTSPLIAAGEYCFEFYYYMYGADIGGKAETILLYHNSLRRF